MSSANHGICLIQWWKNLQFWSSYSELLLSFAVKGPQLDQMRYIELDCSLENINTGYSVSKTNGAYSPTDALRIGSSIKIHLPMIDANTLRADCPSFAFDNLRYWAMPSATTISAKFENFISIWIMGERNLTNNVRVVLVIYYVWTGRFRPHLHNLLACHHRVVLSGDVQHDDAVEYCSKLALAPYPERSPWAVALL